VHFLLIADNPVQRYC